MSNIPAVKGQRLIKALRKMGLYWQMIQEGQEHVRAMQTLLCLIKKKDEIKDYDAFRRARVAFDTIEWDCGVDLDPEFVYNKIKENTPA